jgi:hypothetical protein
VQRDLPVNIAELANTTANGPFTAQAASADSVPANDATHFDDVIGYRSTTDLARRANLSARGLVRSKFDAECRDDQSGVAFTGEPRGPRHSNAGSSERKP